MSESPLFSLIFGTTASGKSALAYKLAEQQQADVLSYDSRHVYKQMDIVTGKDKPRDDFSQTLFGQDLIYPNEEFSIRHFYEYARPIIEDHRQKQRPLILVGGSWLYAQVLIQPPDSLFVPQNFQLRQELNALTLAQLQKKLRGLDSQKFQKLNNSDQNNPRRLIRAIEVAQSPNSPKPIVLIAPDEYTLLKRTLPFAEIEENILRRIENRLAHGALAETEFLLQQYLDWSQPAFSATGYRYLRAYLQKGITLFQLKHLWFIQERDYAKRQLTWLTQLETVL
jgi:tRNA dimethylallyltransferase